MTTRFAEHLLSDEIANIPDPDAVPQGTLFASTDEDIIYQSNGVDTWSEWLPAGGGAGAASALQSARYVRSAGDYTYTGATAFADIDATNLALTITTGARKVLIGFQGVAASNNAAGAMFFDVDLDGARLGGANNGLLYIPQHATGSELVNVSFTYLTATLTADSHTFKLQWANANASHTLTLRGADPTCLFYVVEMYA